jgi:hypothetical protein
MHEEMICQGRSVSASELRWLQSWLVDQKEKSRHRLTLELCKHWQWRTATGRLKNYAARSFLLKLEHRGLISLPPVRKTMRRRSWFRFFDRRADFVPAPLSGTLSDLLPIRIILCSTGSSEESLFRSHLATHHYLGFGKTVGENLQYLVQDRQGHDLACLLFGSAAWKVAARDQWIGWTDVQRQQHLITLTNNTRFLILPWLKVPHLASHILSKILRRISIDWEKKYGHPIHLVETFVEKDRFRGTCYKAANFIHAGETKGRSRQDRGQTLSVPIKDVYLYPLHQRFRGALC